MRVALIADIHGNFVALEAALAAIELEQPDRIICLGDVAVTGPQPRKTLADVRALGCPVVMGNADEWLLDAQPYDTANEVSRAVLEIELWCAGQLTASDREFVRTFQPAITVDLGGATLLCFHGSPRSNTEVITATTPEADLEPMFDGIHAGVLAGGHTHEPMFRRYKDSLLINPGSVGLPRIIVDDDVRNPPWAEYALVTWEDGSLSVDFRRVALDLDAIKQAALDSDMPHADLWVRDWR